MCLKKNLIEIVKEENENKGIFEGRNKSFEELIKHTKKVEEISKMFCENFNIKEKETKLVLIGALLHDVKKCKGKKHHKKGAEYVKQNIDEVLENVGFEFNSKDKDLICLMVRWHKGEGYKKLNYSKKQIKMIEIVKISDKIATMYKAKNLNEDNVVKEKIRKKMYKKIDKLKNRSVKKKAKDILKKLLLEQEYFSK